MRCVVLHLGVGAGCLTGVVGIGAVAATGVVVGVGVATGGGATFLGAGGASRLVAEMGGGL